MEINQFIALTILVSVLLKASFYFSHLNTFPKFVFRLYKPMMNPYQGLNKKAIFKIVLLLN